MRKGRKSCKRRRSYKKCSRKRYTRHRRNNMRGGWGGATTVPINNVMTGGWGGQPMNPV